MKNHRRFGILTDEHGLFQLGGLHSNAYISDLFAREFAKTGMKAYVEIVQRKEREIGTDVLTHQKVTPGPLLRHLIVLICDTVEWSRLCRQLDQDRDRRSLVDCGHGCWRYRVPVWYETLICRFICRSI